ncbi:MAG: glycolate oxidase subunit GlcF [Rhizobiales bacterium]|nr:glycolate oxidase subunit GlcF [Hyphomicrobiales bacterium]MBO6700531.1 glycolate oxidase subunit GlcF [Hyphomicrobiales bacterium]MBO6738067.1 glycolate oxidase subunit GlcF [Hyphomicrobiales bacterium]MBO6913626.1 glycolate oxidase subunit GlcF [Hyphomicrobiales bacterium]MBO6954477.1 glycolate oxidase subunit GlcF [Hyphomicrobiales bacterium]
MQTNFTAEQLADPHVAHSEKILRTCVHCGFCTATCPTYSILGDELDSPRGRIYLMKNMLENDQPADEKTVKHIDRCLSCLSCMTTCPSGVHYMHLVDHARAHIENTYKRPWHDRLIRETLAFVLPIPNRFRLSLLAALFAKPFAPIMSRMGGPFARLGAMLSLAPTKVPARGPEPGTSFAPEAAPVGRVALLSGCAQPVLNPGINQATIDLLTRKDIEVVLPKGEGCCGALVHHMGKEEKSLADARRNVDAWMREIEGEGLDAIIITASGCGTTIKDYAHMLRLDPAYAEKARTVSALACDITEYLERIDLGAPTQVSGLTLAYHSACSMQHGQKITTTPKTLLKAAGFTVKDVPQGHLCCGSAGTYNIMQPQIARQLRDNKVANIESTNPELIATGNIGCMTQIGTGTDLPIIHTVQLLNWAYGGRMPDELIELMRGREVADHLPEPSWMQAAE